MYTNDSNYTVIIHCMTFNHKPYIRQCLDGFVMQKTKFPFIAIVVDDASTDNEQEVLWDFINNELDTSSFQKDETDDFVRVVASHKTNEKCSFVFIFLKYNHYSIKKSKVPYFEKWEDSAKYMAICEGDDYWIDPLKLQKQVDFLESHPDYNLVHSAFSFFHQKSNKFVDSQPVNTGLSNIDKIKNILDYHKYRIQTCTVVMRSASYLTIKKNKKIFDIRYFLMGDTQTWVEALRLGNIYYLPDNTSVYRILEHSACERGSNSVKRLRFDLSCSEMRLYYINKLKLNEDFKKRIEHVFYRQLIKYCIFCPAYIPLNKCDLKHTFILKFCKTPIIRQCLKNFLINKRGIKDI